MKLAHDIVYALLEAVPNDMKGFFFKLMGPQGDLHGLGYTSKGSETDNVFEKYYPIKKPLELRVYILVNRDGPVFGSAHLYNDETKGSSETLCAFSFRDEIESQGWVEEVEAAAQRAASEMKDARPYDASFMPYYEFEAHLKHRPDWKILLGGKKRRTKP